MRYDRRAATAMVVAGMFSVQCGAALATTLFGEVGPAGAVFLRSALAGSLLLLVARGSLRPLSRAHLAEIALFGLILAALNLCFYLAIDRLPLGVVVTLEFLGPLGVAVFGSRTRRDLIWVMLAAVGIALLSDGFGEDGVDVVGLLLALAAGGLWAAYILQSARVGGRSAGLGGLAWAMCFSALLLAPIGIAEGGSHLLVPATLAVGLAVGILNSAVPYALELEALRRIPNALFGVLMSLEPAIAALIGFVALSQSLTLVEVLAIVLVVAASAGALRSAGVPAPRDG